MKIAGLFLTCIVFLVMPGSSRASILLGSNAASPSDQIQNVSTTGTIQGVLGPHGASAAAVDSSGDFFFALPGDAASTVQQFSPAVVPLSSFTFTAPSDSRPSASYIVDLGWGMDSLWASTFTGMVYQLSSSGTVLGSFDTGAMAPGVTVNGTSVFTTAGLGLLQSAPFLYQRDAAGTVQNTINTGLNDTLGVGFDPSSSTYWIGGIDVLSQVNSQGSVVNQFAIEGEHTGVETFAGSVVPPPPPPPPGVPEPATALLMVLGGAALVVFRKARVF